MNTTESPNTDLPHAGSDNPYQSPREAGSPPSISRKEKYARAGRVVVTWERLRILYNVVLVGVVLLACVIARVTGVASLDQILGEDFAATLVFGCFAANGLYLAGPAVDGYLTWFGLRHRAVTVLLFLAGTVLASLLAIACVAFSFSPF